MKVSVQLTYCKTAPHNRYQSHPAEPEQHTKCSNRAFVLLKMGIWCPKHVETEVNNKHIIVASSWSSLFIFRVYFFNYASLFRIWKIHDETRAFSSASVSRNMCGERWSGLPGNPDQRAETSWYKFIHSVVCLPTGPQRIPNRVWAGVSSSNFQYPLTSLTFRRLMSTIVDVPHP